MHADLGGYGEFILQEIVGFELFDFQKWLVGRPLEGDQKANFWLSRRVSHVV